MTLLMGKSVLFLCGAVLMLIVGVVAGKSAWVASSVVLNVMALGENTMVTDWFKSKLDEYVKWLD